MKIIRYEEADPESPDERLKPPVVIPWMMMFSRAPIRVSYHMPYNSPELVPLDDYRRTHWGDKMHYEHVPEEYQDSVLENLEVDTKVIDYFRGDNYVVHRLIRSSPNGKLVEISSHCPHRYTSPPDPCKCTQDYTLINAVRDFEMEAYKLFFNERDERFIRPLSIKRGFMDQRERDKRDREIEKMKRQIRNSVRERRISEANQKEATAMQIQE